MLGIIQNCINTVQLIQQIEQFQEKQYIEQQRDSVKQQYFFDEAYFYRFQDFKNIRHVLNILLNTASQFEKTQNTLLNSEFITVTIYDLIFRDYISQQFCYNTLVNLVEQNGLSFMTKVLGLVGQEIKFINQKYNQLSEQDMALQSVVSLLENFYEMICQTEGPQTNFKIIK